MASPRSYEHESRRADNMMSPGRWEHGSRHAENPRSPRRREHESGHITNMTSPRRWEHENGRAEHMRSPPRRYEHENREPRGEIPVRLDHYPPYQNDPPQNAPHQKAPYQNIPRPVPSVQRDHIPNLTQAPTPAPLSAPLSAPIQAPVPKPISKPISKPMPSPLYFYPSVAQTPRAPPRNFSRIDEEVGIASPYRADDEEALRSLTGPTVNTIMQHKRASRSREWMKTLQSQEKVMRISRKRRSLTPWMKWMNSEWKNHIVAVLGEFIGTTLFLFFAFAGITVAKLQGLGPPNLLVLMYISATFGASLTVNAWIFFRISGGLFNPAVTLALALLRAVPPVRAVLLVITQLMASCLAALLVDEIFPPSLDVATTLGEGTTLTQGFFIEAITTATLVFTIIMLAVEKHRATFVAPLGIGLALFIGHLVAISFTGASLNPARSFGPAVVSRTFASEHWIYWAGPILGAGMAVLFFRLIKLMEYEMANPGQDGDPQNDPTQNPNHEIAQNAQEREEEVVELSPVSSGGFRDGSSWGITQRKVPMNGQNRTYNYADQRGEMTRRLDDVKARWSRSEYGNVL